MNNADLIFNNDGEMGKRFVTINWAATALGDAELWPDILKSTLNICLHTDLPVAIYWGPQFNVLFNDAYLHILAGKTDWPLGATAAEVWNEAWPALQEDILYVRNTGKALSRNDVPFIIQPESNTEESYFDYSLSPILDHQGKVAGIFNTAAETTCKVIASRRSAILQLLVEKQNLPGTNDEALSLIRQILGPAGSVISSYEIEMSGRYKDELQVNGSIRIPFQTHNEQRSGSVLFVVPESSKPDPDYIFFLRTVTGYIETMLNNAMARGREARLARLNNELLLANGKLTGLNNQLIESQEAMRVAVDAAHLATWYLNTVTSKFSGNDLIKEWFGLEPGDEIELSQAIAVIAEEDRQRVISEISDIMSHPEGGDYDTYFTIINPLVPLPRIVRAKGRALFTDEGICVRLSGILQDVTEQKTDELRKDDFIAMVSHELKTPLTSMNGYMQIVKLRAEKNKDCFISNMAGKSTRQISKMITLINGFLNVSRLESGKIHIDRSNFDLALLVKEIEEETIASITSHHFVFAPVVETLVNADRDKIGHVVNNLISNAVKYSPAGTTIHVACVTKNNVALLSVQDTGIGIAKEDIPKLFERYYRVQNAGNTCISGFGIGLYLCCEIMKRHAGKLWVKSDLGKGSTFNFSLPIVIT